MVKKLQALRAKKGFTLVELIVVIAIIGVLAAILVPTMMNVVTKARVSSADQTAKSVADTVTEWLADLEANRGTIPTGKGTKKDEPLVLEIENIGKSTVSISGDIANFKRGDSADSAKTNLQDTFKENYVANKSGYAVVLILNRHVVGCAYSDDVTKLTDLTGISFTAKNFSDGTFGWDSSSKEGLKGGVIIGTNPKLLMGSSTSSTSTST